VCLRGPPQASLRSYFEANFGPVVKAAVKHPQPRHGHSAASEHTRSFGFISVAGDELVKAIMSTSHIIDGHKVGTPELAKPAKFDGKRAQRSEQRAGGQWGANQPPVTPWAPNGMWEDIAPRKVFVGGLSHQTKEQALYAYFSQFGALTDVVVMTEGSARRPRGFGFVTFEDPAAVTMLSQSRYHPVDGRLVEVKPAVPREVMQTMQTSAPSGNRKKATTLADATPPDFLPDMGGLPGANAAVPQDWYGVQGVYGCATPARLPPPVHRRWTELKLPRSTPPRS
jgi:hypothetical protein